MRSPTAACGAVFVASRRRERAIASPAATAAERHVRRAATGPQRADIVVAATASPHLLLEARELAEVMSARDGRPMLLIDLAVPRDIDAACDGIAGISLYDIDDLQAVIARNRSVRQAEARKAEGIIEEEIQHFAALAGLARGAADARRAARPRQRDCRAGGERELGPVGDRLAARHRARRRDRPRRRQSPAARANDADEGTARRSRARADGAGPRPVRAGGGAARPRAEETSGQLAEVRAISDRPRR